MTQRDWAALGFCALILALALWGKHRKAKKAIPDPVLEVVEARPPLPDADSIACPGTDLGEIGPDCYTIPSEHR